MKLIKSHFWYTKRQRNGILILITCLFSVQFTLLFWDFSDREAIDKTELAQFQLSLDSLKKQNTKGPKKQIHSFNPNFITDYKGYLLGLNPSQIDRLFTFRSTGKFVNSAKEFQEVTGVNDSVLKRISPLFKFPSWTNIKTKTSVPSKKHHVSKHSDINKVTFPELMLLPGIDKRMAQRIIAYRKLLKGFSLEAQLFEVYDLDQQTATLILKNYTIIEKPDLTKINVNSASFKSILSLPYIDYELTKRICNYRDANGSFTSLENLMKIDSFPIEKFDRIALYLSAE